MTDSLEITRLLRESRGGNQHSMNALLEAVYPELRRIARMHMSRAQPGQTLQPTALLHEAFIKLAGSNGEFKDRGHFFAVSASAMRQILVDHARAKVAEKRGGGAVAVPIDEAPVAVNGNPDLLLMVDIALSKLAQTDERKARILELRHFSGLSIDEIAETVGVSVATVGREIRFAEAWLKRELGR